jgi:predicted permease
MIADVPLPPQMLHDLQFALRLLIRHPGTTVVAVLALGFGIGMATAIFNAFSAILLRPFPYVQDESRIVFLGSQQLSRPDEIYELSMPDFLDIREQSRTLEGFTTHFGRTMILASGETPERVLGLDISPEGFTMLGVKPHRGRVFVPDDSKPGSEPVAILSYALWQRRFGGKEDAVGRVEIMNGRPTTIIGVMPPGFSFPERHEMWTPLEHKMDPNARSNHSYPGLARLRPGVTLDEARTEVAAIGARLALEYKATNSGKGFALRLLREQETGDEKLLMQLMLGAALFVLVIACANVANLLLAQAAGRAHEVAIRVAVGATRTRLIRQVLTESLVLGLLGGAMGLLVAVWADSLIVAAVPAVEVPAWITFDFDWRVLGFAAAAALGSTLLFGLFPALHASRQTATELKDGGGRTATGSRRVLGLRQGLVVTQVALSAVLLIGAGLFVRSFIKLQATPPGYDADRVLTFRVGLPPTQYTDKEEIRRFFDELTPRLAEVRGVVAVGATSILPTRGNNSNVFVLEGDPVPATVAEANLTTSHVVTAGYLGAMRIPLLRGRMFAPTDTRDTPVVALVDQQFVDRWGGGRDPIGRRIQLGIDNKDPIWATIIGVVGNAPLRLERPYERGGVYHLIEQHDAQFVSYAVRVIGDPTTYGRALQRAVQSVKSGIPIYDVHTMTYLQEIDRWHFRFFGQVFSAFGLGALFLAALGVYGVMSYNISQRSPEIGVRMALGASPGDVVRLVGRQGLILVAVGLAIGVTTALGLTRFMAAILYGISPSDPPTYFALTLVLGVVGVVAAWLPARRATRVDPMIALRAD